MLAQGVKGLRVGAHGGNNKKRARYIGVLLAVAAVVTREFSLGAATDVDSFGELVAQDVMSSTPSAAQKSRRLHRSRCAIHCSILDQSRLAAS